MLGAVWRDPSSDGIADLLVKILSGSQVDDRTGQHVGMTGYVSLWLQDWSLNLVPNLWTNYKTLTYQQSRDLPDEKPIINEPLLSIITPCSMPSSSLMSLSSDLDGFEQIDDPGPSNASPNSRAARKQNSAPNPTFKKDPYLFEDEGAVGGEEQIEEDEEGEDTSDKSYCAHVGNHVS